MGSRRFWLGTCAAILISLLLLGSYAAYRAQRLLEEQRISLDWQQLSLSPRGLRLEGFSLRQQGESGHLQLLARHLQLYWLASEGPGYRLLMEEPLLDWQAEPNATDQPGDLRALLERLGTALPWLPRRIELRRAEAQLPCASGRCSLRGEATLRLQDADLRLEAALLHGSHRAELLAALHAPASDGPLQASAELRLDGEPQLQLDSQVRTQAGATHWGGRLSMPQLGDVAWFGDWLGQWLLLDPRPLPATPQQARIDARWQVQLAPGPWRLQDMLAAPGWLRLDALLQQPWPLPALGLVQGELALDLHNGGDSWQARELHAELMLDPQGAPWLTALPDGLRPQQLRLQIAPRATPTSTPGALALHAQLQGQGPLRLQGEANIELQLQQDWALTLAHLRLDADAARARLAGNRLDDLQLRLQLSGSADAQHLDFALGDGSRLRAERLRGGDLQLQRLGGELAGLRLHGAPQTPQLEGPLALSTQRLQLPQLHAQGWRWQGRLLASAEQQSLAGTLQADSGLNLALRLTRDAQGEARAEAQLDELFLRAGNPLPQTLSDWPELLSLDNGRLRGDAQLRLPPGKPLQAQLALNAGGLGGIYDRSSFTGVAGALHLAIAGNRLELEVPQLSVEQIDPGIALGPLQLQARYQAALARPLGGVLSHQRAELGILGGSLSLAPNEWRLDNPSQLLPLRLSGLDLQQLFRVYPAEGLQGSGLLDGVIPLRLDGQGVSVEGGRIEARAPGGRLRFHSPRIQAMGQANPAMKLVSDALEDFHYDRLGSSLDYDRSGTLRLGMRLQGRNPAIEQGRPIHFNINLEEDIPTLLASLQLTAKVSEIIQQRIQQRMRQRVPQESKE
ncbi:intermembrane phospholipid transport protein YdbH family protein [Pseudomonas sp. SP16.1]|uniref:intermembrane phospholipid transport protein YdbH family protein n=1 Tax=Pseudomonas sp. SP16.1 TaxID=3458854 RepID=UPI0040458125